jgi:hypothetical protein
MLDPNDICMNYSSTHKEASVDLTAQLVFMRKNLRISPAQGKKTEAVPDKVHITGLSGIMS